MRRLLAGLIWAWALGHAPLAAETVEEVLGQALAAEAQQDPATALRHFRQADQLKPNDPFILQKISRQLSDQTPAAPDLAAKRALAEEALVYAQRAAALDPKNPVNVLSLAICYGKLGLYGDTRTKVENSRLIRRYAEEALALDPNYDWAHHVLGRWHYEVAELGATKRFLVRVIYGGLPNASHRQAVEHLERAVALAPDNLAHRVELGFALLAVGRRDDARQQLTRALAKPPRELHDAPALHRARSALAQLDQGKTKPDVAPL